MQCRRYFGAERQINLFDAAILDCNWVPALQANVVWSGLLVVTWCLRTYIGLRPYMVNVYIKERINDQKNYMRRGGYLGGCLVFRIVQDYFKLILT